MVVALEFSKIPPSGNVELLLWLLRLRRRFRVVGASMFPTLEPDEEVLANTRAYKNELPEIGDVVVAFDPRQEGFVIVKRVSAVSPASVTLLGDNPDFSTDSRTFGVVPLNNIIGKVTHKFTV